MVVNQLLTDLEHTFSMLTESQKKYFEQSTVLITGCGGFLGFYFMKFFQKYSGDLKIKKIICLDNFILGKSKWLDDFENDERFEIETFDVSKDDISKINHAKEADYIIHMASIASPTFYRKYPVETLDANIWGLRMLLDYYSTKPIKGLLFFSSSEIYGDPSDDAIPTTEEYRGFVSCTGPRSCYDESKRFGETMCMLFAQKYNLPIVVVRPFNNYGPGMRLTDKRVPADFMKDIVLNKDIVILSNGSPTRTFCYVADSVAGYLKALVYGKYNYFNIGVESPEISIIQLAELYVKNGKDIFDYSGLIKYEKSEDQNYLTNNPQRRCPNIKKAEAELDYNPTITVEEGIRRFMKFIEQDDYWRNTL